MKTNYLFMIVLLSLPLLMGDTVTPDSSSTTSRPKAFIINYRDTSIGSSTVPISDTQSPSLGAKYPPCPGDPKNVKNGFPLTAICPDINGHYPAGTTIDMTQTFNGVSSYAKDAGVYTPTFKNSEVYCPDVCITTRDSTPDIPSADELLKQSVLVDSFENESCPPGYVQKVEFNLQPAIVYLDIPDQLYGPFPNIDEFNAYNNNSNFKCDVAYNTYAGNGNVTTVDIITKVDQGFIPNTQGVHRIVTSVIHADGNVNTCSSNVAPGTIAGNGPNLLAVNEPLTDSSGNIYIGQWITAWTWTPFNYNPTLSHTAGNYGNYSYAPTDNNCTGVLSSSANAHHDVYHTYFRWQHCYPITKAKAWYYTSKYEPISLICARVKPNWTPYN